MSDSDQLKILQEIRDLHKESMALQREQFDFVKKQYDRVEKINDKAEKIQDRAASMFRFIGPLIFVLILILVYILWQYM
ncbi:MAG: hypothetical protein R3D88_07660 [Alphaproteobacteria bacterium]|nr:hypothetical protein [Alphaproteobacteria bacterium]